MKIEMLLPDGITDATPVAPAGWTSSLADKVITWEGGPQPDHEALTVSVEMKFPNAPGETLLFPLVQTCQVGEIRWIQPPNPDGTEPEDPAPAVTLTAALPGQVTSSSAVTSASTSTPGSASATTGTSPTAGVSTTTDVSTTVESTDDQSDSGAAIAISVGLVAAAVGVGAWLWLRRRARRGD